jgi:Polyketide cyclase / dehydrase and lipid transport
MPPCSGTWCRSWRSCCLRSGWGGRARAAAAPARPLGKRRSEVDQLITRWEPGPALAWRHEAERLNGKPAPRFAASTDFTIELEPEGAGTRVRLRSAQVPAGPLRGAVMRVFGRREVAQALDASLERLAAATR